VVEAINPKGREVVCLTGDDYVMDDDPQGFRMKALQSSAVSVQDLKTLITQVVKDMTTTAPKAETAGVGGKPSKERPEGMSDNQWKKFKKQQKWAPKITEVVAESMLPCSWAGDPLANVAYVYQTLPSGMMDRRGATVFPGASGVVLLTHRHFVSHNGAVDLPWMPGSKMSMHLGLDCYSPFRCITRVPIECTILSVIMETGDL
jgi:hypothetical protein